MILSIQEGTDNLAIPRERSEPPRSLTAQRRIEEASEFSCTSLSYLRILRNFDLPDVCPRLKNRCHRNLQDNACVALVLELLKDIHGMITFAWNFENFQENTSVE